MRKFVYDRLAGSADLAGAVSTRIFEGESLDKKPLVNPYLVYRIGNETSEDFSEEEQTPHRVFFQVYVHDQPGSYLRIDSISNYVRAALVGGPFPEYNILRVNYLETSRDLGDDTTRTIMRYIRFQAVRSSY